MKPPNSSNWCRNGLRVAALAATFGMAASGDAQQPPWDGLQELGTLAESMGHPPRGGEEIDVGVLDGRDGVLLVGPAQDLPVGSMGAFLDAGGRLAVLEDVGRALALLHAYRIRTTAPPVHDAVRLHDDPALLLAVPRTAHPLTRDVDVLLTNRPVTLSHDVLRPVFTFADTDDALVLAGAVGRGRLVAVGDASLLLNQMLALPDQRRFAENLIEYLTEGGGELWLVGPGQRLFGRFGQPHRPRMQQLDELMARLSHPDLPSWLVMLLAAAAVTATTVWMLGSLPKVTPYLTRAALPSPHVWAGFAGRVDSALDDPGDLLWPALDYRRELLRALARLLRVDRPEDGRPLVEAADARGASKAACEALAELLGELDDLAAAEQRGGPLPRVAPERLQHMVTTGERLMRYLEKTAA